MHQTGGISSGCERRCAGIRFAGGRMGAKTYAEVLHQLVRLVVLIHLVVLPGVLAVCTSESHSLKSCAADSVQGTEGSFFFGCAVNIDFLEGRLNDDGSVDKSTVDREYKQLVIDQCGCITPENSWKMNKLYQPSSTPGTGRFTLNNAKRYIDFACNHGINCVTGHVLSWHRSIDSNDERPSVLQKWDMAPEEWQAWLKNYVGTVMTSLHDYSMKKCGQNVIPRWDVASEVFVTSDEDGTSGEVSRVDGSKGWRNSHWFRVMGSEYLELVFRWARETAVAMTASSGGRQPKLHYTDYSIETINSKSDLVYKHLTALKDKGVPVDGIAVQGHISTALDFESARQSIKRFASSMEVLFSEVDVFHKPCDGPNFESEQANIYARLAQLARELRLTSFTTWGITDKYSWVANFFDRRCDGLLFSKEMGRKKAYCALVKAFSREHSVDTSSSLFGEACGSSRRSEGEARSTGYCGDSICSGQERCNRKANGEMNNENIYACGDCHYNVRGEAEGKYCCSSKGCLSGSGWSSFCPTDKPTSCPNQTD